MNTRRIGIVLLATLAAALLLVDCGSPTANVSDLGLRARTGSQYVCQVTTRVDRLRVTRVAPGDQVLFTFPPVVTVVNASAARAVARGACGLPNVPSGTFHCPAEFAVSYRLVFSVRGEKGMGAQAIVAHPTGCQNVTGFTHVRTTRYRPGFYTLLARAMGLRDGSYPTFLGALSATYAPLPREAMSTMRVTFTRLTPRQFDRVRISPAQALATALRRESFSGEHPRITVHLGAFTDPLVQPAVKKALAYLIIFDGVIVPNTGPRGGPPNHEYIDVISAATGRSIEGFSYR